MSDLTTAQNHALNPALPPRIDRRISATVCYAFPGFSRREPGVACAFDLRSDRRNCGGDSDFVIVAPRSRDDLDMVVAFRSLGQVHRGGSLAGLPEKVGQRVGFGEEVEGPAFAVGELRLADPHRVVDRPGDVGGRDRVVGRVLASPVA